MSVADVLLRGGIAGENMKKIFILIILVLLSFFLIGQDEALVKHLDQNIHATEMFKWVETLSSPEYEGRLTGTDGYNKAVQLAVNHFKKYRLRPLYKTTVILKSFLFPTPK